jgi:tetratricopeptide (TPR) repeat protein/predicted Ser/Thr protein kinase
MNDSRSPSDKAAGAAGAATRMAGESSASDVTPSVETPTSLDAKLPSDAAETMVPVRPPARSAPDADATMVDAAATIADTRSRRPSSSPAQSFGGGTGAASLQGGTVLGGRYEILQLLGEGGMGAVYKATDLELNRYVALKVIKPELASNPQILARFKQELLLAHQVTHRNVIRTYDLSEADGVKFITMEFIEGKDLRTLIREKQKFTPEETVDVMEQVCKALDAAHSVGVIHRDLKPQNIMLDEAGRVLVMDFGLARTLEGDGMTQSGALLGTMEYMSPEQALGKHLDQRSDIFALGLIMFELLTGKMPFAADSAVASLLKRTQERAISASDVDAQVPPALSGIVAKCLERDLDARYASTAALAADLAAWRDGTAAASIKFEEPSRALGRDVPWPKIGAILTLVVVLAAGYVFRGKLFGPRASTKQAQAGPVMSLAIVPFRNASGDTSLDWLGASLAEMLTTDVGQSASLHTVSADRLHQVLKDLRIAPDSPLDERSIKQLADFSNAQTVVWGQYTRTGGQLRLDATLQNLKQGSAPVTISIEAASEKELLDKTDQLAQKIRDNLALSPEIVKELQQQAFRPTSKSVDALRDFNEGQQLLREGKNLDAQKKFEAATTADPDFALAYSRLAQSYSNLGYDNEAERYSQRAVDLSQQRPAAERYLIQADDARITGKTDKAIELYSNLVKAAPGDPDLQFTLASLYENNNDLDHASEHYAKVLEQDPKSVAALLATGRVLIKSGKAQDSLEPLNQAYSLAVRLENQEQKAAILHAIGVAYKILDKPQDALKNYQDSIAIKREIGDKRGIAVSLNESAQVEDTMGQFAAAEASYKEALQIRRDIGDKKGIGDTLMDLAALYNDRGKPDEALSLYKEALQIERERGDELAQSRCLNNIGSSYFGKGQYDDALTYYQQALTLREKLKASDYIAETVRNLAVVDTKLGQYDAALKQYLRALDLHRSIDDARGMATDSYDMGTVFNYQGRYGAALKAREDALKGVRNVKERGFWMVESLSGYAHSLAQVGREDDAKRALDEASSLARDVKNDSSTAQIQLFYGDIASFGGDVKSARAYYQQALQIANKAKDPENALIARLALAQADVAEGRASAAADLKNIAQQADRIGLKYEAVAASVSLGEALAHNKAYAQAKQELERALTNSRKLGLGWLEARSNYALGAVSRQMGDARAAAEYYRAAIGKWDEQQKEANNPGFLSRADLARMYKDSQKALDELK